MVLIQLQRQFSSFDLSSDCRNTTVGVVIMGCHALKVKFGFQHFNLRILSKSKNSEKKSFFFFTGVLCIFYVLC